MSGSKITRRAALKAGTAGLAGAALAYNQVELYFVPEAVSAAMTSTSAWLQRQADGS